MCPLDHTHPVGMLDYAGRIGSLEQTVKLWKVLKEKGNQDPQYLLKALRAVISCKKQVFDARQLLVQLQNSLDQKYTKQTQACIKEITEFLDTIASRIEYGWQNWDE